MPTFWYPRAAPWLPSMRSLSVMWSLVRSLPSRRIGIQSDQSMCSAGWQKSRQDVCLNTFILQDRTAVFDGVSVYHSRIQAGRCLAIDSPVDADIVVGVPESGNAAALGYSLQSGIPYGTAFVKNCYVGRTFIKPKQSSRESSVRVKLNVLKEAVAGKRVIMIDDSIVRGTTSDRIVHMLREAGAKEVHMRVSSPPFLHPCYFGTDVPERGAADRTQPHDRGDPPDHRSRFPGLSEAGAACRSWSTGFRSAVAVLPESIRWIRPRRDIRGEYEH